MPYFHLFKESNFLEDIFVAKNAKFWFEDLILSKDCTYVMLRSCPKNFEIFIIIVLM
jgi:hypothetical protein